MDKTSRSGSDLKQKKFLLKQLIHRDFKSRYKRTFLGVLWSMLSPLCFFVTQAIVFSKLFGRGEHFLSYLIIGNIVFHYFSDATTNLMFSISANGGIISKINVDKRLFIYSRSISCLINFLLTMIIMFVVSGINGISFNVKFILLIFPIVCLYFLNMGIGYILSVLFVFFKDTFSKVKVSGRMEKWCVNLSLDTLGIYLMHIALLDYFKNNQFIVGKIPHIPGIILLSIVCFVICGIVAAVLRRIPFVGKYLS